MSWPDRVEEAREGPVGGRLVGRVAGQLIEPREEAEGVALPQSRVPRRYHGIPDPVVGVKPGAVDVEMAVDEPLSLRLGPRKVGRVTSGAVGVDVVEAVAGLSGDVVPELPVPGHHANAFGVVHARVDQGDHRGGAEVEGPLPRRQDGHAERIGHERKWPDGDRFFVRENVAGLQPTGHAAQSSARTRRAQVGGRKRHVDVGLNQGRRSGDTWTAQQ